MRAKFIFHKFILEFVFLISNKVKLILFNVISFLLNDDEIFFISSLSICSLLSALDERLLYV
jgi:hypothetical protein